MNPTIKRIMTTAAFPAVFIFSMALLCCNIIAATPDFAFPQTVIGNAKKALKDAGKKGNSDDLVRAAIQLTIANDILSTDRAAQMAALLDSLAQTQPTPYSSVLYLLEARLYKQMYDANAWQYNNRELPTDSFPQNPKEWSNKLFAKKILHLTRLAAEPYRNTDMAGSSMSEIEPLLIPLATNATSYLVGYPTMIDFIAEQADQLLSPFSTRDYILPFGPNADNDSTIEGEIKSLLDDLDDRCFSLAPLSRRGEASMTAFLRMADRCPDWERDAMLLRQLAKTEDTPATLRLLRPIYNLGSYDRETAILAPSGADTLPNYRLLTDKAAFYSYASDKVRLFPDTIDSGSVKSLLANLSAENLTLKTASQYLSTDSITIKLTGDNIQSTHILIYKMSAPSTRWQSLEKLLPGATLVASLPVNIQGTVPFSVDTQIKYPPLPYGFYFCCPSDNATKPAMTTNIKNAPSTFMVSDLGVITSDDTSDASASRVYVIKGSNQQPVTGATVKVTTGNNTNATRLTTDKEGAVAVPKGSNSLDITYGKDRILTDFYNSQYSRTESPQTHMTIYTDLSVYKPGQQVQFAVILSETSDRRNRVLADKPLTVVLSDANSNPIDTLSLTTDSFGRASGKFMLPDNGLLGKYSLKASYEKNTQYQWIEVAEYKAPSFYADIDSIVTSSPDSIVIIGRAKTYSGMPVVGGAVAYKVAYDNGWLWWQCNIPDASYSASTATDETGRFVITLCTSEIKGTPYAKGTYTLSAAVTDATGETQNISPAHFSLGKAYTIQANIPARICLKGDSLTFDIKVRDMLGNAVQLPAEYTLTRLTNKEIIARGDFHSGRLLMPSKGLPSGEYQLNVCLTDYPETSTFDTFILYREEDKTAPVATPLWVPQTSFVAYKNAREVSIPVCSSFSDSYLLCEVFDCDRLISRRWIKNDGRLSDIKVPAPADNNITRINIIGMHQLDAQMASVIVRPYASQDRLKICTLSFRDKLTSGSTERWTFKFDRLQGADNDLAAMAVLSNKALNAIVPFAWAIPAGSIYYPSPLQTNIWYRGYSSSRFSLSKPTTYLNKAISVPAIDTYGQSLFGSNSIRIRGTSRQYASGSVAVVDEMAMYDAAAPVTMSMKMSKNEAAVEKSEVPEPTPETGDSGTPQSTQDTKLRDIEHPLAFFKPGLHTDADGMLAISFEVPDFNTTWQLQLLGYTPDLLGDILTRDVISSKPVMVQTNVPRFLRTGDKTTLCATVFNNTDSEAKITSEMEIFDPVSGSIIKSVTFPGTKIAPMGSTPISVPFEAGTGYNFIGIRVKASADTHTDGEQTLIAILPSSSPVIESTPIYLGADPRKTDITLPEYPTDASVTLQFCDNPAWLCLTALPDITLQTNASLTSKVTALYGMAVANGLVAKMPAAKDAISQWLANPADSVLMSRLQKNEELKAVALQNTPWVQNASTESMRMLRLGHLLDTHRNDMQISTLINDIIKLQNADGGWSWCPGMPTSYWITTQTLHYLGMLKSLGYLSANKHLAPAIKKAIEYCDSYTGRLVKQSRGSFPTSTLLDYYFVRSNFDIPATGATATNLKKTLQKLTADWSSLGIYQAATAAILLNREKKSNVSNTILESLSQRAMHSETKGMWYDNLPSGYGGFGSLLTTTRVLQAYAEVSPKAAEVDQLRQWLLLQKQTEEWGDNPYTAETINAILSCGSDWTSTADSTGFYINGVPVDIQKTAPCTGEFTVSLDPASASGATLTIDKKSASPAWGGIISQYIAPSRHVKAADTADISIKKTLLLIPADNTSPTPLDGESLVGSKVRVLLTVTAARDLDYVVITDERPACLEPAEQVSAYTSTDRLFYYREVRDAATYLFIGFIPKGSWQISYDCYIDRAGEYTSGIAGIQSLYAPTIVSHSAGGVVDTKQ